MSRNQTKACHQIDFSSLRPAPKRDLSSSGEEEVDTRKSSYDSEGLLGEWPSLCQSISPKTKRLSGSSRAAQNGQKKSSGRSINTKDSQKPRGSQAYDGAQRLLSSISEKVLEGPKTKKITANSKRLHFSCRQPGLPASLLKDALSVYGTISQIYVGKSRHAESRSFGYIKFQNAEQAAKAIARPSFNAQGFDITLRYKKVHPNAQKQVSQPNKVANQPTQKYTEEGNSTGLNAQLRKFQTWRVNHECALTATSNTRLFRVVEIAHKVESQNIVFRVPNARGRTTQNRKNLVRHWMF
jgi:hypothetical protein